MWNTAIELAYLNGIEMKNDISLFYHYLFLNRLNRCRKNAIIKMPWFFFYHSLHTHAVEKFKIPLIYRKKIELHFNWSQRQWFEKTCPPPGILWPTYLLSMEPSRNLVRRKSKCWVGLAESGISQGPPSVSLFLKF